MGMSLGEQHESDDAHRLRGWPRWVIAVISVLALLQVVTIALCKYAPPEGMVSTGLHIPDSALFIQAMYMFDTDFYSPYATSFSEHGSNHYSYFSIPHLWFYGAQGAIAGGLGLDYFLFYGLVNGICAALFLASVYWFMRTAAPRLANIAFLLFALGGSIGGVLFLGTAALGLHDAPGFEDYFWRFAVFELLEGAHLFPVTYYPRSYYTFSLACCFAAFAMLIRAHDAKNRQPLWLIPLVLVLGAFVNARFGVFTAGAAVLYLIERRLRGEPSRFAPAALFFGAVVAGQMGSFILMSTNPVMIENHVKVGNFAAYFSPLVSAGLLILPLFLWQCAASMKHMAGPWRWLTGAGLGYLAAFAILFVVYQAYYGNLLVARDAAAAVAISDRALVGAVIGLALAGRKRKEAIEDTARREPREDAARREPRPPDWIIIWGLGFLALSISAFGQGWFLRFGPQRLMVPMYVPICVVAAYGLHVLLARRPRVARAWAGTTVACGVLTIAVAAFHFQAPVGRKAKPQPFDKTLTYAMTEADAELVGSLEPAIVVAPAPLSDVIALTLTRDVFANRSLIDPPLPVRPRRGVFAGVSFGIGTFNMTDQPFMALKELHETAMNGESLDPLRRQVFWEFGAKYLVQSDTWPHVGMQPMVPQPIRTAGRGFVDVGALPPQAWSREADAETYLKYYVDRDGN